MHLSASRKRSASRKSNRLPKHFPVGTTYVVEGHGGADGQLRVFSRYVVLPDGKRINLAPDFAGSATATASVSARSRCRARSHNPGPVPNRTKRNSERAKKIVATGGTPRQSRR
jgi:hypothetical protein